MKISCENINNSYQNFKLEEGAFMKELEGFYHSLRQVDFNFKESMERIKNKYDVFEKRRFLFLKEVDPRGYMLRKYLAKRFDYAFVGEVHDGLAVVVQKEDVGIDGVDRLSDMYGNCILDMYCDYISYQGWYWRCSDKPGGHDDEVRLYATLDTDGSYIFNETQDFISGNVGDYACKRDGEKGSYVFTKHGVRCSPNFANILGVMENGIIIVCEADNNVNQYYFDLNTQQPLFNDGRVFYACSVFDSGIAMVKDNEDSPKYYIDTTGKRLFADKTFEVHSGFINGRAVVKDGNGYFCIDTNGEAVWGERRFKEAFQINENHLVIIEEDGVGYFVLDHSGKSVDDVCYRSAFFINPKGSIICVGYSSGGKTFRGLINEFGKLFWIFQEENSFNRSLNSMSLEKEDLVNVYSKQHNCYVYINHDGEVIF